MWCQLEELGDSLHAVDSSQITAVMQSLAEATEVDADADDSDDDQSVAMSAADLSASIDVMTRVAYIHSSRRRSLEIRLDTMTVSITRHVVG